ncbi:MAG: hypothetical protein GVY13_05105 [Alphaproteobacteria bacterium]|nr:hypothetical protein [Alphaproteobacteria bacterium]
MPRAQPKTGRKLSAAKLAGMLMASLTTLGSGFSAAQEHCPSSQGGAFNSPMAFHVMSPDDNRDVLFAVGEIVPGTAQEFEEALNEAGRIDELWFHSPGGNGQEGLALGRKIRERGLFTRVPAGATCFSACSYAFLGGVLRAAHPTACYGVHMFTFHVGAGNLASHVRLQLDQVENINQLREVSRELEQYLDGIEQDAAELARHRADYLIDMSISLTFLVVAFETRHEEQYWLTPDDLTRLNVLNMQ